MDVSTFEKLNLSPVRVSVIMGVYNQMDKAALDMAVDSILRQTLRDFEFIIYDDGSVPEAARYVYEQGKKDPRIRVYGVDRNQGLAFSLNSCAALARGAYIARMDADDIAREDRLERQYRFLEEHPEMDWCGSNAYLFDGQEVWGVRVMPELPVAEDFLRFSPYIHPTVMYRRELLRSQHYDTGSSTLHCEDYEIFMRLLRKGYRGCNLQENLLYYRENMDSYGRRTLERRLNEAKIRYHNFRNLGILFPKGWLYVLRPIAGILAPNWLIAAIKKKESGQGYDSGNDKTAVLSTLDRAKPGPDYSNPKRYDSESRLGTR